jgi:predicted aspartyl protease
VIEGVVHAAYEPVVTFAVQGPSGQSRDIDAVVDTGFNGFLTLPTALVAELRKAMAGVVEEPFHYRLN